MVVSICVFSLVLLPIFAATSDYVEVKGFSNSRWQLENKVTGTYKYEYYMGEELHLFCKNLLPTDVTAVQWTGDILDNYVINIEAKQDDAKEKKLYLKLLPVNNGSYVNCTYKDFTNLRITKKTTFVYNSNLDSRDALNVIGFPDETKIKLDQSEILVYFFAENDKFDLVCQKTGQNNDYQVIWTGDAVGSEKVFSNKLKLTLDLTYNRKSVVCHYIHSAGNYSLTIQLLWKNLTIYNLNSRYDKFPRTPLPIDNVVYEQKYEYEYNDHEMLNVTCRKVNCSYKYYLTYTQWEYDKKVINSSDCNTPIQLTLGDRDHNKELSCSYYYKTSGSNREKDLLIERYTIRFVDPKRITVKPATATSLLPLPTALQSTTNRATEIAANPEIIITSSTGMPGKFEGLGNETDFWHQYQWTIVSSGIAMVLLVVIVAVCCKCSKRTKLGKFPQHRRESKVPYENLDDDNSPFPSNLAGNYNLDDNTLRPINEYEVTPYAVSNYQQQDPYTTTPEISLVVSNLRRLYAEPTPKAQRNVQTYSNIHKRHPGTAANGHSQSELTQIDHTQIEHTQEEQMHKERTQREQTQTEHYENEHMLRQRMQREQTKRENNQNEQMQSQRMQREPIQKDFATSVEADNHIHSNFKEEMRLRSAGYANIKPKDGTINTRNDNGYNKLHRIEEMCKDFKSKNGHAGKVTKGIFNNKRNYQMQHKVNKQKGSRVEINESMDSPHGQIPNTPDTFSRLDATCNNVLRPARRTINPYGQIVRPTDRTTVKETKIHDDEVKISKPAYKKGVGYVNVKFDI